MVLGSQIKRHRRAQGLTQEKFAPLAALSGQKEVSQLERGEANPTLQTISDVAHALGIPVSELFSLEGVPTKYVHAPRRLKIAEEK